MLRRLLAGLILLASIGLVTYTVLFSSAKASPNELTVVSHTKGYETVKAEVVDGQIKFSLKNNHKQNITAYAISIGSLNVIEDFAYSETNDGISPGETFQSNYEVSPDVGTTSPSLNFLTVVLGNGNSDGIKQIAQKIRDERQGEKVQIHRGLQLLEKYSKLPKDLKALKKEVETLLDTDEEKALATLNELQAESGTRKEVSDKFRQGLIVGRGKMIQRIEALEQFSDDYKETAFTKLKTVSKRILTRL